MIGGELRGLTRAQLFKIIKKLDNEFQNEDNVFERNNVGNHDSLMEKNCNHHNNIDSIYKIKQKKHKIICLKDSYKNIMKLIEETLGDVKPQLVICDAKGPTQRRRSAIYAYDYEDPNNDDDPNNTVKSLAIVIKVQEGSPADLGGLCENDKVLRMGPFDADNIRDIHQLPNLVKQSVDQPLDIRVRRNGEVLDLTVVPQQWEQPGIFGCTMMKQWCIVKVTT